MKISPLDRPIYKAVIALAILVICFSIAAILSMPGATTPSRVKAFVDSTSVAQTVGPVDVTGAWTTQAGDKLPMTANISADTIEIDIAVDGATMSYWYGTFSNPVTNGAGIQSVCKEHPSKTFLSSAKSKPFVYRDGKISFEYSGMGVTKKMELIRV